MKKYVCLILTILCITFGLGAFVACEGNELPETALDAPTNLAMKYHWVLDWYGVQDATSYVVTLNTGETYETEETQLDMQFLSPGETYTISVYAKGGTNEVVSDPSELTLTMPAVSEGLTYTLIEDGTAYEVSGRDFVGEGMVIFPDEYEEKPITRIAMNCFRGTDKENITGLRLPQKLESISGNAFSGTNVEKVVLPNSLKEIYGKAFAETKLTEITIPESVTTIKTYAFQDCASLSQVTILADAPKLGRNVFDGTAWLDAQPSGFVYAGNVLYCHKGNFSKNSHFDCATLADATIADGAFAGCRNLTSVDIPADIRWGEYTFLDCVDLKTVNLAEGLTEIPNHTFEGCSKITQVEFPSTLKKIGDGAFKNAGFRVVVFPDTVTEVGAYAFDCPDTLQGVIISENIVSLGTVAYAQQAHYWAVVPLPNTTVSYKEVLSYSCFKTIYVKASMDELLAACEADAEFKEFCSTILFNTLRAYAYSEDPPTEDGNYWHYDTDGVTPIVWA